MASQLFLLITFVSLGIQFFGLFCFLYFMLTKNPKPLKHGPYPSVTILKPCYLTEDNEVENYRHFFQQDYPGALELVFIASRSTDPAVPLVQQFLAQFPQTRAKLLFSTEKNSYWGKIDAVKLGLEQTQTDIVIISDSDVSVHQNYVSQVVGALSEPQVTLVSTPQLDHGANNFATGLKTLANNCDSALFTVAHHLLQPTKNIALGHSIGFWMKDFNELPANKWDFMSRFLAEDQAYGHLFGQAGKKIIWRNIFCPVSFANKSLKQVYQQKVRWLINQKMIAPHPLVYLLGILIYSEIPGLIYCALQDFQAFSLLLLLTTVLVRIFESFLVERLYLGSSSMTRRYWWTIPLWDVSQLYFFIHGFFKKKISYGLKVYRVVNKYYLEEDKPTPPL